MNEQQPDPTPRPTFWALATVAKDTVKKTKIVVNTLRQLVDAALIAVCVSAFFNGFAKADEFTGFAQIAFACALPMLIIGFMGASIRPRPSMHEIQLILVLALGYGSKIPEGVGWIAVAAGVVSVIWHGNGSAALALIPASIVAVLLPAIRLPEILKAWNEQKLAKTSEEIESLVS